MGLVGGVADLRGLGGWLRRGRAHLFDLQLIAQISPGDVVGEGLRADELVVGARGRDDVAVARNLPGKARDGASNCGKNR